MIYDITNEIANKFTGGWVDRAVGMVRLIKDSSGRKRPYANTVDPNDCAADLLVSPDERYKTLLYFEYIDDAREDFELENGAVIYKLPVRLVVWANGRALGDDSGEVSSDVIRDVQRQIKGWGRFNLEEFSSVSVKIKKIGDKNFDKIFGKYGANEAFKGFYLKPNDFLSMDLEIEFIPNCGTFAPGDPTCGNGQNNFPPAGDCEPSAILDSEGNTLFEVDSGGEETLVQIRVSGSGAVAIPITSYSNGTIGTFGLTQIIEAFSNLSEGNDPGNAAAIVAGLDANLSSEIQALICASVEIQGFNGVVLYTVPAGSNKKISQYRVTDSTDANPITLSITEAIDTITVGGATLASIISAFSALGSGEAQLALDIANNLSEDLSDALEALICPTPEVATVTSISDGDLFTIPSGGEQRVDLIRIDPSIGTTLYLQITGWQSVNRSFLGGWTLQGIVNGFASQGANESIYAQDIVNGLTPALSTEIQALICTTPGDATVNVNGNLFDTVAPEGVLNVPVQYDNGTPVGTIDSGIVKIPNPTVIETVPRPIYIAEPTVASTDTGDLKDLFDNGIHDYQKSDITGKVRRLGVDNYTLHTDTPNHFGTTHRYTLEDGTQAWTGSSFTTTWGTNTPYVIIDHLYNKVILQYNIGNGSQAGYFTAINAFSLGSYEWRGVVYAEAIAIFRPDDTKIYHANENLLRRSAGSSPGVNDIYFWTVETRGTNATQAYRCSESITKELRSKTDSSTLNGYYVIANYNEPVT